MRDRHRRRTTALRKAHLLVPAPAEIATAMDVRVGTVKSLISRGLDSLAVDLEVDR